jgi:hypothetical protein
MRFWAGFACGRKHGADRLLTKQRLIVVLDDRWRKAKEHEHIGILFEIMDKQLGKSNAVF